MPGFFIGPGWRMLTPSWDSILMTSAPSSARIWVAYGPMTTVVRSRTFTPSNGPGICVKLFRLDLGGADEFTPVADLFAHEAHERFGVHRFDLEADGRELAADLQLREDGKRVAGQPRNDLFGRSRRREH